MAKRGKPKNQAITDVIREIEKDVNHKDAKRDTEKIDIDELKEEAKEDKLVMDNKLSKYGDYRRIRFVGKFTRHLLSNNPDPHPETLLAELKEDDRTTAFHSFRRQPDGSGNTEIEFIKNTQVLGVLRAVARFLGIPATNLKSYMMVHSVKVNPIGKPGRYPKQPVVRVNKGKKMGGGWVSCEFLPAGSTFEVVLDMPFKIYSKQINTKFMKGWLQYAGNMGIGHLHGDFGRFIVTNFEDLGKVDMDNIGTV